MQLIMELRYIARERAWPRNLGAQKSFQVDYLGRLVVRGSFGLPASLKALSRHAGNLIVQFRSVCS